MIKAPSQVIIALGAAIVLTGCRSAPDEAERYSVQLPPEVFRGKTRTVEHEFTVRNPSSAPMLLREVSSSCSCITAIVGQPEVAPGEATTIRMSSEIGQDTKAYQWQAVFGTGLTDRPLLHLQMGIEVFSPLRMIVDDSDLQVDDGEPAVVDLRVESCTVDGAEVETPSVTCSNANVSLTLVEQFLERPAHGVLRRVDAYQAYMSASKPSDTHSRRLTVEATRADGVSLSRDLQIVTRQYLSAFPREVCINPRESSPINIRIRADIPFMIESVETHAPGLNAECATLDHSRMHVIRLVADPSQALAGGNVVLNTSHPNQRHLKIPVRLLRL